MRKLIAIVLISVAAVVAPAASGVMAPVAATSLKFAVIGDFGTGKTPQYQVGAQLAMARETFPYQFVLALGDNLYGSQKPKDFFVKFEKPYEAILNAGVPFYATLGNHDDPDNRFYEKFNMRGERYYTHVQQGVRFVVLDTNLMDTPQLVWVENTLRASQERWKIAVFHHPLYSNAGRHGSNMELRVNLEPLLVRYGVSVVFSGHEHVYERHKPQKGITYFTEGSSGQLRAGDLQPGETTAASFDQDRTFMLVEIVGERMIFQTLSRVGTVVDSGEITRRSTT
ncbi:MAG: metallophosphoesterase [Vicinamibacterales bacterium]